VFSTSPLVRMISWQVYCQWNKGTVEIKKSSKKVGTKVSVNVWISASTRYRCDKVALKIPPASKT